MPKVGATAVVIPVPSLDPVVSRIAERWPDAVREGVPAHLTVLYPFVPGDRLDSQVLTRCRELCADAGRIAVRFVSAAVGAGIVSTAPVPADRVAKLSRAFVAEWPEYPPYDGQFGEDPAPHVSLGLGVDEREGREIAEFAQGALPVHEELSAAVLVELTDAGWRERAVLPM